MIYDICLAEYPTYVHIPGEVSQPVIPIHFREEPQSSPDTTTSGNWSPSYAPRSPGYDREEPVEWPVIALPSIAFTNKENLGSVVLVCLRTRLLKIDGDQALSQLNKFLAQFPKNKGFKAIKNIMLMEAHRRFPHEWSCLYDMWDSVPILLRNATSLRSVSITMLTQHVCDIYTFDHAKNRWYSSLPIEKTLRLVNYDAVLDCPNLQSLTICHNSRVSVEDDVFNPLISWFREGFGKRGRKVHVETRLIDFAEQDIEQRAFRV